MLLNKWSFCRYKEPISFLNFRKTVPFGVFTDISTYAECSDKIKEALNLIQFPIDQVVCIGNNIPTFGYHLPKNVLPDRAFNDFCNSTSVFFCLSDQSKDLDFIFTSVIAGAIPICLYNENLKRMGLTKFGCDGSINGMANLISDVLRSPAYYSYLIKRLALKYDRLNKRSKT